MRTNGISPKAVLAFLYPAIAALGTALASWIASGNFNKAEVLTAVGGVILSGVAALGAYIGKPGDIDVPDDTGISGLPLDKPMPDHLDLPDEHPDAV